MSEKEQPVPEIEGKVTIPYRMLLALCHDAGWRVTGNRDPKSVTVYNRVWGCSPDIKED